MGQVKILRVRTLITALENTMETHAIESVHVKIIHGQFQQLAETF